MPAAAGERAGAGSDELGAEVVAACGEDELVGGKGLTGAPVVVEDAGDVDGALVQGGEDRQSGGSGIGHARIEDRGIGTILSRLTYFTDRLHEDLRLIQGISVHVVWGELRLHFECVKHHFQGIELNIVFCMTGTY
ncbi:hypothetical protein ABIC30_006085 [Methylobacterium sp. 1030]